MNDDLNLNFDVYILVFDNINTTWVRVKHRDLVCGTNPSNSNNNSYNKYYYNARNIASAININNSIDYRVNNKLINDNSNKS